MQDRHARPTMSPPGDGGFTLVEVLVAMVITLVALMGLLQSVQIVNETNLRNQMREEAVQVGGMYLNSLMAADYSQTAADTPMRYSSATRLRGLTSKYYVDTVRTRIGTSNSKNAVVTVSWRFKTFSTSLQMSSIKSE